MIVNVAAPLTPHGGLDRGLASTAFRLSMPFRDVSVGACLSMNRLGKYSFARHRRGPPTGSQLTAGEWENTRPRHGRTQEASNRARDRHQDQAPPSLCQGTLPERMDGGQRICLRCKVVYCGLAERSAQGTLVLSPQPCHYRGPSIRCRTNIHLTRGDGMQNAPGLL